MCSSDLAQAHHAGSSEWHPRPSLRLRVKSDKRFSHERDSVRIPGYWSRAVRRSRRSQPGSCLSSASIAAPLSQHSTPSWQKRHKAHRRRSVPDRVAHVGTTVAITPAPISNSICSRQIERISQKMTHCIDYSSAKNKSKGHNEIQRSARVRLFQRQK